MSETVQTADGIALATTLYRPSGSSPFPGAVLAHMGGGHQADWGDLGKQLQQAGFAVLTFDFRGHGRSGGALDPPNAATDLRAALAALRSNPDVDGGRIGLVGASMGGMASVIVAASDPGVRTVVAISTSPGAAGQNPLAVVGALSPRPFLALGCDGDPLTRPERVQELYDAARQPKELAILECDAHGNGIFGTGAADQVVERVMAWFERYVKPER